MEKQVIVVDEVHASMPEQELNVLMQLLTHFERMVQLVHEVFLLRGQLVWVLRVDSGKITAEQVVGLPVEGNPPLLVINILEELPVLHLPFRLSLVDACFLLELYHGNGLVHLCRKPHCLLVELMRTVRYLRHEFSARIILIGFHGKGCQWHQIDAIALLQRSEVGIAEREPDDIADTGVVTCTGPHPQDVVITPLDIPVMIVFHEVHDEMGSGATVIDVAENVQLVNGQSLNDITNGNNKVVSSARRDDGVDDDIHIGTLVGIVGALMQKLLNDVAEILGQ